MVINLRLSEENMIKWASHSRKYSFSLNSCCMRVGDTWCKEFYSLFNLFSLSSCLPLLPAVWGVDLITWNEWTVGIQWIPTVQWIQWTVGIQWIRKSLFECVNHTVHLTGWIFAVSVNMHLNLERTLRCCTSRWECEVYVSWFWISLIFFVNILNMSGVVLIDGRSS